MIGDLFLSFATHDEEDDNAILSLRVKYLHDLLLAIGDHPSKSKLSRLTEAADMRMGTVSSRGTVSSSITTKEESSLDTDSLIDSFHTLNADNSGDFTMDALSGLLSTAGVLLSEDDARGIMNAADTNHDDKISIEEFLNSMTDRSKTKY